MLRDVNGNRSMADLSMSRQFKLEPIKFDYSHRDLHCYFVNFDARFFNSKRVSQAFVDLLRSTYAHIFLVLNYRPLLILTYRCKTPTLMPRMALSYVFDPRKSSPRETDFSFLAASLASRLINPIWTFVVSSVSQEGATSVASDSGSAAADESSTLCIDALRRFRNRDVVKG
jgi:hypothetical protein